MKFFKEFLVTFLGNHPRVTNFTFHHIRKIVLREAESVDGINRASEIAQHSSTRITKEYYLNKA